MRILLLTEKWAGYKPSSPISCTDHMLVNTLKAYGDNHVVVYPDEQLFSRGISVDDLVIETTNKENFDIVVFDIYHTKQMKIQTIEKLKKNTKVVCVWFDTRGPDESHYGLGGDMWSSYYDEYSRAINLNVVVDCLVDRKNFITLFVPQDEKIYSPSLDEKTFDVCFVGNLRRTKQREEIVAYMSQLEGLRKHVENTDQTRNSRLTPEDYANIYKKSVVGLNICGSQMKSRVYEIMHCGTTLLSDRHPVMDLFFEPTKDYIQYNNKKDMEEKLRYYLANPEELSTIRNNGLRKVKENCSSNLFWKNIENRVFNEKK